MHRLQAASTRRRLTSDSFRPNSFAPFAAAARLPARNQHDTPILSIVSPPSAMFAKNLGHEAKPPSKVRASSVPAPSDREPAGSLAVASGAHLDDSDTDKDRADKRVGGPSVMGFGRRKEAEAGPVDIPLLLDGVKVDVFVRCRPLFADELRAGEKAVLKASESEASVKMKSPGHGGLETYFYDAVFGPDSTQVDVYNTAAKPIVDNVLRGMNCCMFAYGQTGTGKTHTTVGDLHDPVNSGIIPRAVSDLFAQLRARGGPFKMSVSFLEVYNEQLMDLLIAPEFARPLRLVEDPRRGVVCQNLTEVPCVNAEEVYALIAAGNRRCQVAATNMNERSNRAHRIFIVTVAFSKFNRGVPAKLREAESILRASSKSKGVELDELGCLTIVDLAGSESVGRSGATDARLTEAGNINKSLLTLGRVINALANNEPRIPYRDSKLTRLVAEALGGRCKTAIIATVAPGPNNAQESASTLKYAERAKSALNATQLSKTQVLEAKLTRLAQLYKELQMDVQTEREAFEQERQLVQKTHSQHIEMLRRQRRDEVHKIIEQRDSVMRAQVDALTNIQRVQNGFLRSVRKTSSKTEATLTRELQSIVGDTDVIKKSLTNLSGMTHEKLLSHSESVANLVTQLSGKLKHFASGVHQQVERAVEQLAAQRRAMEEFAESEQRHMKKSSEELIQGVAKLLSKSVSAQSSRLQQGFGALLTGQKDMIGDISKVASVTQSGAAGVAGSVMEWAKDASSEIADLIRRVDEKHSAATAAIDKIRVDSDSCRSATVTDVREIYGATVHHSALVDSEAQRVLNQLEIALRDKHDIPDDIIAESMIEPVVRGGSSSSKSVSWDGGAGLPALKESDEEDEGYPASPRPPVFATAVYPYSGPSPADDNPDGGRPRQDSRPSYSIRVPDASPDVPDTLLSDEEAMHSHKGRLQQASPSSVDEAVDSMLKHGKGKEAGRGQKKSPGPQKRLSSGGGKPAGNLASPKSTTRATNSATPTGTVSSPARPPKSPGTVEQRKATSSRAKPSLPSPNRPSPSSFAAPPPPSSSSSPLPSSPSPVPLDALAAFGKAMSDQARAARDAKEPLDEPPQLVEREEEQEEMNAGDSGEENEKEAEIRVGEVQSVTPPLNEDFEDF